MMPFFKFSLLLLLMIVANEGVQWEKHLKSAGTSHFGTFTVGGCEAGLLVMAS